MNTYVFKSNDAIIEVTIKADSKDEAWNILNDTVFSTLEFDLFTTI